jgi:hypothetical protein
MSTEDDVDPQERKANAAVIVDDVPPSSWGPYSTAEQAGGITTWSWLLWIGLALGAIVVVAGAGFLLVNRQVIISGGEPSV